MNMYATLTKKYGSDVDELRKILVKRILDEGETIESYDILSLWAGGLNAGDSYQDQFVSLIYRVKSALPTSTTEEIFGDLMSEVISRESVWAEGWSRYFEKTNAKNEYERAKKNFSDNMLKTVQENADC